MLGQFVALVFGNDNGAALLTDSGVVSCFI